MPNPLILAFDTSVAHCAAALLCGDEIRAHKCEDMSKGQAERLFPILEETLQSADKTWADLTAIAVGTGPGNFTGIRISVSAARGLALALDIPAIGVSYLEAQAYGIEGAVLSTLDARRGKVFFQHLNSSTSSPPVMCEPKDICADMTTEPTTCVGYLSDEIATKIKGSFVAPPANIAINIAHIVHTGLNVKHPRPAPLYIRQADAAPPRDPAPRILP